MRTTRRRLTRAGAIGFTGEVYIGYAPRSRRRITVPQKSNEKVELKIDDKTVELPVIVGTENEKGIDIGKLRAQTGYVTLDPAFMNTASTTSAITYLDGEKGILRYRGIPIEELAEKSTFVEVAYLLIYGKLPNSQRAGLVLAAAHPPLDAPRGHEAVLRQLPRHGAPDGDPVGDDLLAVQLLSAGAGREEPRGDRHHHRAPALEDAHHRRLLVQEVDRAAVRLSAQQPQLLRELSRT